MTSTAVDLSITEELGIAYLQDLDVDSCKDASELLYRIVEGDTLNKNSKLCETNANNVMNFLENNLIPKMKEQSLEFRYMYRQIYGTGSYYDELRNVSDLRNTEMDVNIVLSLFSPTMKEYFLEDNVKIITDESVSDGFIKILCDEKCIYELQKKRGEKFQTKCHFKKIVEGKNSEESHRQVKYFLHPNKTLRWFCKLVESSIKQIKCSDLVGIESFSEVPTLLPKHGPSKPIHFVLNNLPGTKQHVNVDLVVAFQFNTDLYNPSDRTNEDIWKLKYETEPNPFFFAIPKIMQSKKRLEKEKETGITSKSDSLNWRIDFHDQERIILDSEEFPLAKPTIKILKLYKHIRTLKLSSYLIKSVVMRLISSTKEHKREIFMAGEKLDEAVLSTMSVICSFLHKRKAPYLFDIKCNLFWNTSSDDLDTMLKKISKDIERIKNGGIEEWLDLLIKTLPYVDEINFSKRGVTFGKAWEKQERRRSNYQCTYRDAKDDDEGAQMLLTYGHMSKPNRIRNRKKK